MEPVRDRDKPDGLPVYLITAVYALLLAVAVAWSALRGDRPLLQPPGTTPVPGWQALAVGAGSGLLVVLASRAAAGWFTWARRLEAAFAELVGPLTVMQVLLLAAVSGVAEEAFFRGAMQPALGLTPTALIFGLLHVGPARLFLPWTAMAIVMGFALGVMFRWGGTLIAPVLCHAVINALNLHRIAVKAKKLRRPPV